MKLYPGPRGFSLNFSSPKRESEPQSGEEREEKFQEKPLGQDSEAIFYLKNLKFTCLEINTSKLI